MKKYTIISLAIVAFIVSFTFYLSNSQVKKKLNSETYQEGDIIFQSSKSRQCEAVKLATHSDISHCGLLFKENNQWFVMEAVEPVSVIRLDQFIARGTGKHYQIMRLKSQYNQLSSNNVQAMKDLGKAWVNRHYDLFFNWGNNELYCSELVWKLYHDAAGIELCALKTLQDYDLKSPLVKQMMQERYGANIPWNEPMIAPSDIAASEKVTLIEQR